MVTEEVLLAADANMRAAWRATASFGPSHSVLERDDVQLVASGLPVGLFNPAFVLRRPSDATALVAEIAEHYRGAGLPFVVYFRDAYGGDLAAALAASGLVEHYQPPLMVMDPIATRPPAPAGVEIVPVDEANLDGCHRALSEGFGMPLELVQSLLSPEMLAMEPFSAFLALVDGAPAGTAASFVTGETGGVYNVATVPAQRGKGVGAAVTWAAVEAGARAGAKRSILQASAEGAPVYERMGYTTPDRYRQFEPAS